MRRDSHASRIVSSNSGTVLQIRKALRQPHVSHTHCVMPQPGRFILCGMSSGSDALFLRSVRCFHSSGSAMRSAHAYSCLRGRPLKYFRPGARSNVHAERPKTFNLASADIERTSVMQVQLFESYLKPCALSLKLSTVYKGS